MKRALLFAFVLGCSHADVQLREEQARTRKLRDEMETQAQQLAALKARVAELQGSCK